MHLVACLLVANAISDFLRTHLILVALTASAGWFYAGHQYFEKGNLVGALLWETIAILVLVAFCVNVLLRPVTSWVSIGIALVAIGTEVWLIRRWMSEAQPRA
jgi:hypothetical protein